MATRNSSFNSVLETQSQQQENAQLSEHKHSKISVQKQSNFIRILFISILVLLLISFVTLFFYYQNQIIRIESLYQSHIEQQKLKNINEKKKFKSFFKSWKNSYNNENNLKKIQRIKELLQVQNSIKNQPKRKQAYLLSMNNYRLSYYNNTLQKEINQLLQQQHDRMSSIYDFNLQELPFCIIICTVNNSKDSRYEHNLRSILNQNYTNFKVVIVDDASKDENFFLLQQLVDQISPPQKVYMMQNQINLSKLPNVYKAAYQHCDPQDIGMAIDGDDELLGVNVFKVFNHMYQKHNLSFAYSNSIVSFNDQKIVKSWVRPYSKQEDQNRQYRSINGSKIYGLASFKISNFLKIKSEDFKDENMEWFRCAADEAMWAPLLELSCGRQTFIDEYFYLAYKNLGNQDTQIRPQCNKRVKQILASRPMYPCQ